MWAEREVNMPEGIPISIERNVPRARLCATARPTLTADTTPAERARAEACHVRARERAEHAAPYMPALERPLVGDAQWRHTWGPLLEPLALATAPVWVPLELNSVRTWRKELYEWECSGCMTEQATEPVVDGQEE